MTWLATALVRTSGPLTERRLRALHGTARELNPRASVGPGAGADGFRVAVRRAGGSAAAARAEAYRITMYLVCHAGLDVVEASGEVREDDGPV